MPAELLTPEQLDPFNVNNTRPILPEHVPVIEAYLRVNDAFATVASRSPIDPNAAELAAAPYTPEARQQEQTALADRSARGEVLDVSQGETPRPYVIGAVTEAAVIYDCYIDGAYWLDADGGPIPPTVIWQAAPGNVVEVGVRIDMVRRNSEWLYEAAQIDNGACT